MLKPKIIKLQPKKLVGKMLKMSLRDDRTFELWNSFRKQQKNIPNIIGNKLYNVQVYDEKFPIGFNASTVFEKWATIEVEHFENLQEGLYTLELNESWYAVFQHKGTSEQFGNLLQIIFTEWLPSSDYVLTNMPHFEVLTEKYLGLNNPDSEEEVWIPIKKKN